MTMLTTGIIYGFAGAIGLFAGVIFVLVAIFIVSQIIERI